MSASEQEMERARSRVRNRLCATNGSWTREESDADLDLILALGALRERRKLIQVLREATIEAKDNPGVKVPVFRVAADFLAALEGATDGK